MPSRLTAIYHVRADARAIEARAQAIAIEQSVEMPLSAIEDRQILDEIVGKVEDIGDIGRWRFRGAHRPGRATVGNDAGPARQHAVRQYVAAGRRDPARCGISGRTRAGITAGRTTASPACASARASSERALTCSALKPQGLAPARLAELAARFARGGIDYIKDDHGLADQAYSPFAARCAAVAEALRAVERETGRRTHYVPSLTGDLDALRAQIAAAKNAGIDTVMVQPMIMGLSNFTRLVRGESRHRVLRASRVGGRRAHRAAALFGKIFRMLGADALVFPNHGGRFGYSPDTCRRCAARRWRNGTGSSPRSPVPAGGMSHERVAEMLDFYGADVMLLIGGALLEARERLTEETAAFVDEVKGYRYAP